MSITVHTDKPEVLLSMIKKAIDDKHIETWEYNKDGNFTHPTSSGQWKGVAWLKPYSLQNKLIFGLIGSQDITMTKRFYAIYHGRFIEMLLAHFDEEFIGVNSTALGDSYDQFKARDVTTS